MGIRGDENFSEREIATSQHLLQEAKEALGDTEFESARARGAAMDLDEISTYVPAVLDRIRGELDDA